LGCGSAPGAADVARALRIYRGACLLLWLLVGVAAWAL
jgi:adenosylcobinamide-phosphate synthase